MPQSLPCLFYFLQAINSLYYADCAEDTEKNVIENQIPLFTMFSPSDSQPTIQSEGMPDLNSFYNENASTSHNIKNTHNGREKEQTPGGWDREKFIQNSTTAERLGFVIIID